MDVLQVNEVAQPGGSGTNKGQSMYSTLENQRLFLLKSVFSTDSQVFLPVLVHPPDERALAQGPGQFGAAAYATGAMYNQGQGGDGAFPFHMFASAAN